MKMLKRTIRYEVRREPRGEIRPEVTDAVHEQALSHVVNRVNEGFNCGDLHVIVGEDDYTGWWESK